MKITSFAPFIVSTNGDEVIKTFEKLGFEVKHLKDDANSGNNPTTILKNADGYNVGVTTSTIVPRDMVGIRMNVEDFDEAYNELTAMGFKNVQGDRVAHSETDESCMMASPTGFVFVLSKHIK